MTFGDDGEKFGTWPDTKTHVYEQGWLREFFNALDRNSDWLRTATLATAVRETKPVGKAYLPDCSYREMTEWALPVARQHALQNASSIVRTQDESSDLESFMRGGFWRNFKTKYAETDEMYARMMAVSRRLEEAESSGLDSGQLAEIRDALYRGQCNCPYWHGAFGGVYLPHLRNAIFEQLISADTMLDEAQGVSPSSVLATADDYNFDGLQEIRLSNNKFCIWLAPSLGGRMYEFDVKAINHNLLATLQRREESYHKKVLAGPADADSDVASIHDRVVFKQADLDQRLQYDRFARKTLMDHFYDNETTLDAVVSGAAEERGDFVEMPFDAKLRRSHDRVQVKMRRAGNAWGIPITLTKAVTMSSGSDQLLVTYMLENLPPGQPLHFSVEQNFSGLPSGADDRYFCDEQGNSLGHLGSRLDLQDTQSLRLSDRWLGMDVSLQIDRPSGIWAFPVETVSQSEAGFELVHQSVCVQPHWIVNGDENGRWVMNMTISAECETLPVTVDDQKVIQL